jgi:UDP-glucose 4-epimerase
VLNSFSETVMIGTVLAKETLMNKKKVLVVGGAGFIGSHVNKMLHRSGYDTWVLDNLSQGDPRTIHQGTLIQGEMGDPLLLKHLFEKHLFDAVIHFAAFTDVGESMALPLKYYRNNVAETLVLLEAMQRHGIKIFIFSSTAAIFGLPQQERIAENHPRQPINPYGRTKLIVEEILNDLSRIDAIRFCALRYFNAAGGDPDREIKSYKKRESNLIPLLLKSLLHPEKPVTLYGSDYPTADGTCIRDYVHIEDLGAAHIAAMEQLWEGAPSNVYNLGNGRGFSVREVLAAAEEVTGRRLRVIEGDRRIGDPPILVADATKAKLELAWKPRYPSLEAMIADAWAAIH